MTNAEEPPTELGDPSKKTDLVSLIRDRLFAGIVILVIIGIAISAIGFFVPFSEEYFKRFFQELGIGFLVTAAITGAAQVFLIANSDNLKDRVVTFIERQVISSLVKIDKTTEAEQDSLVKAVDSLEHIEEGVHKQTNDLIQTVTSLGRIEKGVQKQTYDLLQAVASLNAMRESGIERIYANRTSASNDIASDLTDTSIKQIRLIGISLNDFVLGTQPILNKAWETIEQLILNEKVEEDKNRHLDIRILIIDPNSLGAQLRLRGEERGFAAVAGRLKTDVEQTAKHLYELQKGIKEKGDKSSVKFEFRLYRVPPIMFLCRTDLVSYVQQYHFWGARAADGPIPILKYRGLAEASQPHSMHLETATHFDWIWDNASISAEEFLLQKAVGIDKGMYSVGAVNVFHDPKEAGERLLWHIRNAKTRLYLEGISLKSFFDTGDLFKAIIESANRNVDIRILLLNPESEQAYYRSFREYLFQNSAITFEGYRANSHLHTDESELNIDTTRTMRRIRSVLGTASNPKIQVRSYDSAPVCFLCIADDSALVEQYHYGKILPAGDNDGTPPVLLGKDTPLIEYVDKEPVKSDLYESNPLRIPFKLMLNHFNFVFDNCAKPL